MSGFRETANIRKYDKGTTAKPGQGEEVKEKKKVNITGYQSCRVTELVKLHTAKRDFKVDTP